MPSVDLRTASDKDTTALQIPVRADGKHGDETHLVLHDLQVQAVVRRL